MRYYWLNSISLQENSVVLPGTWVRLKRALSPDNWVVLEEIYERIRQEEYPELASRVSSNFLFIDKTTARQYQKFHRQADLLYEVEVVDRSAPSSVLDMQIVFPWKGQVALTAYELEMQARNYWGSATTNPSNHKLSERVVESPIKIFKAP